MPSLPDELQLPSVMYGLLQGIRTKAGGLEPLSTVPSPRWGCTWPPGWALLLASPPGSHTAQTWHCFQSFIFQYLLSSYGSPTLPFCSSARVPPSVQSWSICSWCSCCSWRKRWKGTLHPPCPSISSPTCTGRETEHGPVLTRK